MSIMSFLKPCSMKMQPFPHSSSLELTFQNTIFLFLFLSLERKLCVMHQKEPHLEFKKTGFPTCSTQFYDLRQVTQPLRFYLGSGNLEFPYLSFEISSNSRIL